MVSIGGGGVVTNPSRPTEHAARQIAVGEVGNSNDSTRHREDSDHFGKAKGQNEHRCATNGPRDHDGRPGQLCPEQWCEEPSRTNDATDPDKGQTEQTDGSLKAHRLSHYPDTSKGARSNIGS